MWIFTSNTFVSVVQHREADDILCVRGRFAGDAARFLGLPPEAEEVTPAADYRFRCYAHREQVMDAVAAAAKAVDYPNFKKSVSEKWRESVLMQLWHVLFRAQAERVSVGAKMADMRAALGRPPRDLYAQPCRWDGLHDDLVPPFHDEPVF